MQHNSEATCWTCSQLQSLKNQPKCGTECSKSSANYETFAGGWSSAPDPDEQRSLQRSSGVAFPADANCPCTRESFLRLCAVCWSGGPPDILSVYLLVACTSSPKVFQPLTPLISAIHVIVLQLWATSNLTRPICSHDMLFSVFSFDRLHFPQYIPI